MSDVVSGGAPATSAPSTPAPAAQPQAARTPEQASNNLDARVAAKRHAAEHGSPLAPPKGVTNVHAGPERGPDGKFLPKQATSEGAATEQKPADGTPSADEPKQDAAPKEIETLKATHAKDLEARDAQIADFKKRDEQWNAIAEKALAKIETLGARVKQLEAALTAAGGAIDPRDVQLATFQERERARQLEEERRAAFAEEEQARQAEAQRKAHYDGLVASSKAALAKYPELAQSKQHFANACRLVLNGGDPEEVFALYAAKAKAASTPAPQPPRAFVGKPGGATPKLTDLRDIADKWHARLRQPA